MPGQQQQLPKKRVAEGEHPVDPAPKKAKLAVGSTTREAAAAGDKEVLAKEAQKNLAKWEDYDYPSYFDSDTAEEMEAFDDGSNKTDSDGESPERKEAAADTESDDQQQQPEQEEEEPKKKKKKVVQFMEVEGDLVICIDGEVVVMCGKPDKCH